MSGRVRGTRLAWALTGALAWTLATVGGASGQQAPTPSLRDPVYLLSVGRLVALDAYGAAPRVRASEAEGDIQDRSLTPFDRVFVQSTLDGHLLDVGDAVQFFRLDRTVADPRDGSTIGRLLVPTGIGRVDSLTPGAARVRITHAYGPVRVGDRARAVETADTLPPAAGPGPAPGIEGRVVAFQDAKAIHPPYDVAFLTVPDPGALTPGDRVELVRPRHDAAGAALADVYLGEAEVVRVEGGYAAAVLTAMARSDARVGDRWLAAPDD